MQCTSEVVASWHLPQVAKHALLLPLLLLWLRVANCDRPERRTPSWSGTSLQQLCRGRRLNSSRAHVRCSGGRRCRCGVDCSLVSWRQKLPHVFEALALPAFGDIYQFGVFEGEGLLELAALFPKARLWGFDSFEGFPEERGEDLLQVDFRTGHYSAGGPARAQALVEKLDGLAKVGFVPGFFDRTLTPDLRDQRGMSEAIYIDIDADLYTSTYQALDWAFRSGVARPGTLIGYDDFWTNPCSKGGETLSPLDIGEGRAHKEIAEKYGVRFSCIAGPCRLLRAEAGCRSSWGVIFLVETVGGVSAISVDSDGGGNDCTDRIGDSTDFHGFEFSSEEVRAWKALNPRCRFHFLSPYHWLYSADT
mmetsp:Transcript_141016/g.450214  ORF Transcript_141016/g.450214 Transcript_141016/m.450214 type:complete len:363 (+) Transcript_141016:78-1166(+)